jgi:hypothetical protein
MYSLNFLRATAMALLCLLQAAAASAQQADALIGTWVTNVEKSTLTGTPFKSQIRTFDYSDNGLILCTLSTVTANGNVTFFHWFTRLDGVQHNEFSRSNPHKHTNSITLKKTDGRTFEIIGITLATGKQHLSGTATITEDGKTMEWRTTNLTSDGRENKQIRILEKQ